MTIRKDVLVYSTTDMAGSFTVGGTLTMVGQPDAMTFTDDEFSLWPADFGAGVSVDSNQTLYGTLEGTQFSGNNGTTDAFEFERAFLVEDSNGVQFSIYEINNTFLGGSTVGYVSEVTLDPDETYTIKEIDVSVNDPGGDSSTYAAEPDWDDLAGQVNGASGDDVINVGYVDGDDDVVDGSDGDNDVIFGGGGNDTINAGEGDDVIYGDNDAPLPAGTTEYVVQGFIRDLNFELTGGDFNVAGSGTSFDVLGDPLEIRIIDNDSGAGDDAIANETPDDTDQLIEINGVLYNFVADFQLEFLGSDGVVYTMLVIDADRDGDGVLSGYSGAYPDPVGDAHYEDGQVLLPVGAVPPAGVTLTITSTPLVQAGNPDYTSLNGGAVVTDYDDTIDGGAGDDTIFGGEGNDTIDGGAGRDILSGGDGDDTFVPGPGHNTIKDFNVGNSGSINDGLLNNDFVDLSGYYSEANFLAAVAAGHIDPAVIENELEWLRADQADGVLNDTFAGWDANNSLTILDGAGVPVDPADLTTDNTNVNFSFFKADPDGIVDGEEYGETMGLLYDDAGQLTDGGGDIIDGPDGLDDFILGNGGDDNIFAGLGDDEVYGGDDNDTVDGGDGNDLVFGDAGDDTLIGGAGNDELQGGTGNDDLEGGDGNDLLFGDAGIDTISGGGGDDELAGGAGNDDLDGGVGNDLMFGDAGDDNMTGGLGDDTLVGGTGVDIIDGGADNDLIFGGAGDDVLIGDDGNDQLQGGVDNDILAGGDGSDILFGQDGDDTLIGGAGVDTLVGGAGNDDMDGEDGDDQLVGGLGDNQATGGAGNDIFYYTAGENLDITDFGLGSTDADDGDGTNNDFVYLADYYTNQDEFEQDLADDGILNQSAGDYTDNSTMAGGEITGLSGLNGISASSLLEQTGVPCFVRGTRIATVKGLIAIEDLKVGDKVITRDDGVQEIRWIGSKTVPAKGKFAPIKISAGVLGPNDRDLWLSPNHRVLRVGGDNNLLFGTDEVFVAAKHLVGQHGITQEEGVGVQYFHMMFDTHQVVLSNDIWTESYYPGHETMGKDAGVRDEILELFPELAGSGGLSNYGDTARVVLKAFESSLVDLKPALLAG
ncbi:Ca2+-binding protein, RTX toxin-related [Ruegeria halocynthiae]|uniref:Ca2+-binding protein, RTX toxin-related n=1 Tax=Ruegeria halocynthiae TaxID=985054 RepID=A0A1H3F624_9RHOB|nr:Hint domain-containing protein [Ruegeria halocynthiae]SDX86473.1 Ca2+-binding protein, RTX toxin-related [Ruegeria halocynthiae]